VERERARRSQTLSTKVVGTLCLYRLCSRNTRLVSLFALTLRFNRAHSTNCLSPVCSLTQHRVFHSGHVMGVATLLYYLLNRYSTSYNWLFFGLGTFLVALVGVSRVHTGSHFPSQVLAGLVMAYALAYAVYRGTVVPLSQVRPSTLNRWIYRHDCSSMFL